MSLRKAGGWPCNISCNTANPMVGCHLTMFYNPSIRTTLFEFDFIIRWSASLLAETSLYIVAQRWESSKWANSLVWSYTWACTDRANPFTRMYVRLMQWVCKSVGWMVAMRLQLVTHWMEQTIDTLTFPITCQSRLFCFFSFHAIVISSY